MGGTRRPDRSEHGLGEVANAERVEIVKSFVFFTVKIVQKCQF